MDHPSRRSVLAGTTAAVAASIAGCFDAVLNESDDDDGGDGNGTETGGEGDERAPDEDALSVGNLSIEGWNVIDLVERGADPTGEENVTGVLESHVTDDTLIVLPAGRYRMTEGFTVSDLRNVGLVGCGATIEIGPDFPDAGVFEFGPSGSSACENVVFGGLEYDFTESNTGASIFNSYCSGFVRVEGLSVAGTVDTDAAAARNFALRLQENGGGIGRAHVGRVRCPDGGFNAGMWLEPATENCQVYVTESYVANFEDNGFYANTGSGACTFERCLAKNNSISNFRLGGAVRDSRVVLDDGFTHEPDRPRGFWLRSTATRVENCAVVNTVHPEHAVEIQDTDCVVDGLEIDVSGAAGGTTIRVYDYGGYQTTLRNVRIEFGDAEADEVVRIENGATTVRDLSIRSEGPSGRPILVDGASDTTFVGLDVESTGDGSEAMSFEGESAAGAVVRDSRLDVAGSSDDLDVAVPDVRVENTEASVRFDGAAGGVRGTIDGLGTNAGDPSETGGWNGNGRAGVTVEDTETGDVYLNLGGEWKRLG